MLTSDQPKPDLEVVVEPTAKEQACQHLRELLLAGAASPLEGPADAAYFDELRSRVCRRPES